MSAAASPQAPVARLPRVFLGSRDPTAWPPAEEVRAGASTGTWPGIPPGFDEVAGLGRKTTQVKVLPPQPGKGKCCQPDSQRCRPWPLGCGCPGSQTPGGHRDSGEGTVGSRSRRPTRGSPGSGWELSGLLIGRRGHRSRCGVLDLLGFVVSPVTAEGRQVTSRSAVPAAAGAFPTPVGGRGTPGGAGLGSGDSSVPCTVPGEEEQTSVSGVTGSVWGHRYRSRAPAGAGVAEGLVSLLLPLEGGSKLQTVVLL